MTKGNPNRRSRTATRPRPPHQRLVPPPVVHLDGARPDYDRVFRQLCHLVSLSRTNKKPEVVKGIVETVLVDAACNSVDDVADAVLARFGLPISTEDFDAAVGSLLQQGLLRRERESGRLSLSDFERATVLTRIDEGYTLETTVRDEWLTSVRAEGLVAGVSDDCLWTCLRRYMARVFRQHGVRTTELLAPAATRTEAEALSLAEELDAAARESGVPCTAELRHVIGVFFGSPPHERARYLAQLLDGTFTFFALATPSVAAGYLRQRLSPIKLFLDTNILFDLLGLHDDPGVSLELVKFVRDNELPVQLLAHERSVREFRGTADGAAAKLCSRTWTPALSNAALLSDIGGFERRFHELNAKTPTDPRAFMSRFDHVHDLLREHGVEVYREPQEQGYTTEHKGLLFAEYHAYIEESGKAEKPDGVLDHDIVLYLAVERERRDGESALECGSLLVTNDGSLYSFDYRRTGRHAVPRVSMPAPLLQVLRPFGVPTQDFDERFVETFAVPEFRTAHADYSETASNVAGFLASCEGLAPETAAKIMSDQLLMSELNGLDEHSTQFRERIEAAFALENSKLLEERDNARRVLEQERAQQAAVLAAADQELAARDEQIADLQRQREQLEADRAAEKARADREREEREHERAEGDADRAARDRREARQHLITRATAVGALVVVLLLVVWFAPAVLHWRWEQNLAEHVQAQIFVSSLVVAVSWSAVYRPHRKWVWGAFAVSIVPTLLTIL